MPYLGGDLGNVSRGLCDSSVRQTLLTSHDHTHSNSNLAHLGTGSRTLKNVHTMLVPLKRNIPPQGTLKSKFN